MHSIVSAPKDVPILMWNGAFSVGAWFEDDGNGNPAGWYVLANGERVDLGNCCSMLTYQELNSVTHWTALPSAPI